MNRPVPFVPNHPDNLHCVLAVFRMLIAHYLGEDPTWEDIDRIAHAVPGKGTWTFPLESYMAARGIAVRSIESVDYRRLASEGLAYLHEAVGARNARYYEERTNLPDILPLIPDYIRLVPHETRKATVEEISAFLSEGKLVAAEVDSGRLNGGGFELHAVLLYATDGRTVTMHDPGLPPRPARCIPLTEFSACFSYEGSGCGIAVFG